MKSLNYVFAQLKFTKGDKILLERKKSEEEILHFLESYDFLQLGQAINRANWRAAAMTTQRMQKKAESLELEEFSNAFTQIRQCILHQKGEQAKNALARITVMRIQERKLWKKDKKLWEKW